MKKKSILLVGVGRFGRYIAEKLDELGHDIMAVDQDEERVGMALPFVTSAQIGDSTNKDFLLSLGPDNYDVVIVTISGDFQSSLETTSLLKELGAKFVVARAERDGQAKFLRLGGADEIVYPEKQLALWTAIRYSSDHILDYIELDGEHAIFEVTIPEEWIGKSIRELDIRKKFNINILGTKQDGKMNAAVNPGTVLTADKTLMVLGNHEDIQRCFHI